MTHELPNSRLRAIRRVATRWIAATALLVAFVPGEAINKVDAAPIELVGATIDSQARCCERAVRLNPPQPPASSSVGIVGDSLFVGISDRRYLGGPSLQEKLQARGSTTWTVVKTGMTMPSSRSELRYRSGNVSTSDVIVIGLGTNDIFNAGQIARAAWGANIVNVAEEARSINPDVRLVWVDVAFRRFSDRATVFNDELNILGSQYDIEVCAWQDELEANPQWLANDGLHLDSAGYRARRDTIERCIVGW